MEANLEAFTRWVERNTDPRKRSAQAGGGPVVSNSQLLGAAAALAAQAGGGPVVSNSQLMGSRCQDALAADRRVQAARKVSNQAALETLTLSPATGCAMTMNLAIQASGYNPAAATAAGNRAGFLSYVDQLLQCPAFSVRLRDQVNPGMSGDWGAVISQIASFYVGISGDDLNHIRNSLYALAQAASSTPGANETMTLFVQCALNVSDDLNVYMYWSQVQMVTHVDHGGKHSPDTVTNNASLSLNRNVLAFNSRAWATYAPIIFPQTTASLESWLNDTTTPQGPVPVKWNA
jgi:hypothetical protein